DRQRLRLFEELASARKISATRLCERDVDQHLSAIRTERQRFFERRDLRVPISRCAVHHAEVREVAEAIDARFFLRGGEALQRALFISARGEIARAHAGHLERCELRFAERSQHALYTRI